MYDAINNIPESADEIMRSPSDDDGMHNQVGWMTPADVSILTFLSNCKDNAGNFAIQTPMTISLNTGYSDTHVGARCRTLETHGLIERTDRGKYRLSDDGASLLNGGMNPSELED